MLLQSFRAANNSRAAGSPDTVKCAHQENPNMNDIKSVAGEFGMSVEQFVRQSKEKLPGQLPSRSFYEGQDSDVDLCLDLNANARRNSPAWKRIKRAAKFTGQTVREFLTSAIMEEVRLYEGDMILSPRTGKPIYDRIDDP